MAKRKNHFLPALLLCELRETSTEINEIYQKKEKKNIPDNKIVTTL